VFLAVVWSIAGGVVLLLVSFSWVGARVSELRPEAAVRKPSAADVARCRQVVKALPRPPPELRAQKGRMYGAWRLGHLFGEREARVMLRQTDPVQLARSSEDARGIAKDLEVPDLPPPGRESVWTGLSKFTNSLAADPECIGAALESRHSLRHAEMFRLGAVAGFAAFERLSGGETSLEPEIETYAAAAGISIELWRPLVEKFAQDSDRNQATRSAISRIEQYIKGQD
jgi:hypothetical protein